MAKHDFPPTRRGYDVRECVSALQKAIRRSDVPGALYWQAELCRSGYTGWCWKRLRTIMSEDCGIALEPGQVADVLALYQGWKEDKSESGGLFVIHATIILASAKKSRLVDWVAVTAGSNHVPRREVPDEALDKHTLRGARMGRRMQHFIDEAATLIDFEKAEGMSRDQALALYEDQYAELFQRLQDEDPTLPVNEWAYKAPKPKRADNGVKTHVIADPPLPGMEGTS